MSSPGSPIAFDAGALRGWGLAASAAAIVAALAIAWLARAAPPPPAAKAELGFAVRFGGAGPIARAQARALAGAREPAALAIARELERQGEFSGLCFDGFTPAAEVLLRSCAGAAGPWLPRLQAMPAVVSARVHALRPKPEPR
jgi:hypothetical protein